MSKIVKNLSPPPQATTAFCFCKLQCTLQTPWCRVLLEKLTLPQLAKKLPACYAYWARWIKARPSGHVNLYFNIIFLSVPKSSFKVAYFLQVSPSKPWVYTCAPLFVRHVGPSQPTWKHHVEVVVFLVLLY
jgi:hypothetical protein